MLFGADRIQLRFAACLTLQVCWQGYELPRNVVATTSALEAIDRAQYAIHAVPVQHSREFLSTIQVRQALSLARCTSVWQLCIWLDEELCKHASPGLMANACVWAFAGAPDLAGCCLEDRLAIASATQCQERCNVIEDAGCPMELSRTQLLGI